MLSRPEMRHATAVAGPLRRPMSGRLMFIIAVALVMASLAIAAATRAYTYRYLVGDAAQRGLATLNFHAEAFEGSLDKYRILPALMARRADVRAIIHGEALSEPDASTADGGLRTPSRDLLGEHAALTGAHAIAVSGANGRIFASSLRGFSGLAVSADISQQVHFAVAAEGRLGRQTIVTPAGRRLYLFSSAIRTGEVLLGVVTVAVDLERLEQPWTLTRDIVLAYEPDGLIVLSNREELRLQSLARAAKAAGSGPALIIEGAGQGQVVRISNADLSGRFVMSVREVPALDWAMIDLANAAPISQRATTIGGLAGMAGLLLSGGVLAVLQRRRNLARKLRDDRATALRLERLVRDRTADLQRARDELIQATKLAALGQMSASIAHEFNQPLAAILSNADNAATLMERGEPAKANESLSRIRGLVERLGATSRALKTFARKPRTKLRPVSLKAAAEAALMVLQPRRRETGVDVRFVQDSDDAIVLAGAVRMEQVIVNLVANAIDAAMLQHPDGGGLVEISIFDDGRNGTLSVRDNGLGIAVSPKETVFDPFVTTKDSGDGLGLGLSITYNIVKDFSGTIDVENMPGGGASFTVVLPLAGSENASREPGKADVERV